jgi:hypothetical protein
MQSTADLDDLLNRVKKAIDRKFAPLVPPGEQSASLPPPPAEDEKPKKLKLEK